MSFHADQYIFNLREQRGVTTDLGSDPTLVSSHIALSSASYDLDPFRLIPISHARVVATKSTLYHHSPPKCNADIPRAVLFSTKINQNERRRA